MTVVAAVELAGKLFVAVVVAVVAVWVAAVALVAVLEPELMV